MHGEDWLVLAAGLFCLVPLLPFVLFCIFDCLDATEN